MPQELREIIGKRELQAPLGADRRDAMNLLPQALMQINARLDHARTILERRLGAERAASLTRAAPMSADQLASTHYQEQLALDLALRHAGPSWASVGIDDSYVTDLRAVLAGRLDNEQIEDILGSLLDRYRRRGNLIAAPGTSQWRQMAQAIASAELEFLERMVERDEGADPAQQSHPVYLKPAVTDEPPQVFREPVSLRMLLEAHLKALEREGRGRAGRKAWPRVFEDLLRFLKEHRGLRGSAIAQADDARRLTTAELIAWRDRKLEDLAGKTVKDVWLASVKATLQRAVDDQKLEENPARGLKVRIAPPVLTRPKGYTDEALVIVRAARNYDPPARDNPRTTESGPITAAKRWGPWLCAFTGARVTEIMQLRRSDVMCEGDIHFVRITPDAGSVKTRAFRDVPIHGQLIELGFLKFVAEAKAEPLFYSASADPAKHPAETTSGRLSAWLRKTGLSPEGVQPNHAWRHRFKTVALDLGLNQRVVDAIQGHAGRTASDGYGDVSLRAKYAVISALPAFEL